MNIIFSEHRPAGYAYLLDKLDIAGIPHWHTSSVSLSGTRQTKVQNGFTHDIYPSRYWPGETIGSHLEFALKYDGVNLGLLSSIFERISQDDIIEYINSKPTGKYARRIWFFYEFLTGKELPIANISSGNYVDALDTKQYYTVSEGDKSRRHRVVNNLLGVRAFCPVIRRTEKLSALDSSNLRKRCEEIIAAYPPHLLRRALSYLYNKETKSSFEIEHITPSASRVEKFITALELAEKDDFCQKQRLVELQNRIVDHRFASHDYRKRQNYIGQTVTYRKEIVHFICPKPGDLPDLMNGLIEAHKRMQHGKVPPIIHAAAIAYGLVFLHPFEDGNGRIHRFLIHNILSIRGAVPRGLMFPVSAVMLKNPADYDASLESFSRPLMKLIDYRLDNMGQMTVKNDTATLYRYIDMTAQAEALYAFVTQTVDYELTEELNFLVSYDKTKAAIRDIIDMPDHLIDLFIRLCLQNNGKLSAGKRASHFCFLSDDELTAIEQAVKAGYNQA